MEIPKYFSAAALVATFLLPTSAKAVDIVQDLSGISLKTVGSASEGVGFFNTVEFPAASRPYACAYELYYVKLDTPGGRAIYATLLNTKNLGKKLVRFDVNRVAESGGVFCYISLVVTQD